MSRFNHLRRGAVARACAIALLTLASSCAAATPASARPVDTTRPVAHIALGMINPHAVSGTIVFAARNVGPRVREVIFAVDGHHRWRTHRRPFHYQRRGLLNTRSLRNGVHVLSVLAVSRSGRVHVMRQRIIVHNVPRRSHHGPPPPPPPSIPFPVPGAGSSPVTLFGRDTFQYSSLWSTDQEAHTYQVMVMQSTDSAQARLLKAANPSLKIFVYMDPMDSKPSDPYGLTTCTTYNSDVASHPDWFLADQNGNPILYRSNSENHVMDVGNPAYQQACVAHAVALAQQDGFDGIHWDDIDTRTAWVFANGVTSPKYPTDTAFADSYQSFVDYAGPAARAQGLLSIGNIGGANPAQWAALTTPLDGSEEESFTDGGVGLVQQLQHFADRLEEVAWSELHGKLVLTHSYNTTEAGNTFGLASLLLVAHGQASYSTANGNYASYEAWYPEYTTAQQLGPPTGPVTRLSNGAYVRKFANGLVLVNASAKPLPSFSLGGGVYSGSNQTDVTSVSMPPTTGLILLKVG